MCAFNPLLSLARKIPDNKTLINKRVNRLTTCQEAYKKNRPNLNQVSMEDKG